MNRYSAFPLALLTAAMPMVLDSAFKGAALLAMATVAALTLWRASAAARHLVWLVAVLALLLVPVLSVVLPGWRVLPAWAVAPEVTTRIETREVTTGTVLPSSAPMPATSLPHAVMPMPSTAPVTTQEAFPLPSVPLVSSVSSDPYSPVPASWLPLAWSAGCLALLLRLFSAHWLLRRASRRCQETPEGRLTAAFAEAAQQLGVRQRIRFLLDEKRTIPVVWGVIWPRLILPAEALSWDDAKLRSVLLHELAHIRRRDTLVQWLTQLACALHWFNPLVWLAAWRLHTERERACDDLVLASGVKASSYAGHLLDVASKLTPARWTSACGLAMARKSSLESRLRAVLSGNLNRRGVTRLLALAAVLLTAAVVVPLAMLRAAEKGSEKEKSSKETEFPNHPDAYSLFQTWQAYARSNGDIPGALIGQLAKRITKFTSENHGSSQSTHLAAIQSRMDGSRDWTSKDASALLDEICVHHSGLVHNADYDLSFLERRRVHRGRPLPATLENSAWGPPAANGLRVAYIFSPMGEVVPLGSPLQSRVLFHNSGKEPVFIQLEKWFRNESHTALDSTGKPLQITSILLSGSAGPVKTYRLDVNDYCELPAAAIAAGFEDPNDEYPQGSAWSVIQAKVGDRVRLSTEVRAGLGIWETLEETRDPIKIRNQLISDRVSLEAPLPESAGERVAMVHRVMQHLLGTDPTSEETTSFVEASAAEAFDKLIAILKAKPMPVYFAGSLSSGTTEFRVGQGQSDNITVVKSPGFYGIGGMNSRIHLEIKKNDKQATATFLSKPSIVDSEIRSWQIPLVDTAGKWAFAWERGSDVIWLLSNGALTHFVVTDHGIQDSGGSPVSPFKLKHTLKQALLEATDLTILAEYPLGDPGLQADDSMASMTATNDPNLPAGSHIFSAAGKSLRDGTEGLLRWGPTVNGLRAALMPLASTSSFKPGDVVDFNLVLQNVSFDQIRIATSSTPPSGIEAKDASGNPINSPWMVSECGMALDLVLEPGKVVARRLHSVGIAKVPDQPYLFPQPVEGAKSVRGRTIGSQCPAQPGVTFSTKFKSESKKAGYWSGTVVTGDTPPSATPLLPDPRPTAKSQTASTVSHEPKTAASKSLFNHWKRSARADGKIPGGCIGQVAASLKTYMDLNAGTEAATKCDPAFKKCDASHDWTLADAAALLDEIETVAKDHAAWTMRGINEREIHPGKPLPDDLKDAPWGTPAINGLRMAWLCGTGVPPVSPEAAVKDESNKNKGSLMADGRDAHATLNSILTSRILFHNTGKAAVCFATEDWIQSGSHSAKDAMGKEINIWSTQRMGIRTRMIFRLAPGEYAEVVGHGIGIGSHETAKETDIRKVGAWIEAKEGDEVTFTPGKLLVSFQTWQNNEGRKDSETVWNEIISARLAQEGPNPASEKDRAALLARVSADLGIALPYDEAKFTYETDPFPDAFERLTKRFLEAAKPTHFAGELSGGETKFTVTTKAKDQSAKSDRSNESHGSYSDEPRPPAPKHEYAQALFKQWRAYARTDGKIPGTLIGHVAEQMDSFLKQHPTDSKAAALAAVRPRLDATHDWTPEDVVKLMDDITEISTAPISWAGTPMEFAQMNKLLPGKPLPEELQKANWGEPADNGLRAAYLLAPSATEYPLNKILKARVLFHNTGNAPVIFRTETWHQNDKHQASGTGVPPVSQEPSVTPKSVNQEGSVSADGRDAHATPINVASTWYTGMTPIATYRLAPGEYAEVPAHGIAIGAGKYEEEHSTGSVGAVIEATAGQTVRFSTEVNAINEGWTRPNDPKDPNELYLKNIADRIALEAPLPKSTADRELLIVRAMQDLFGQPPTEAEVAMFTTDVAPDALEKLTARLQAKPRPIVFSGNLQTGETTFKVLPADPNAATAPRTATSPGRYVLGDKVHLQITQTTAEGKRKNRAEIIFLATNPKQESPHKPHAITLPDKFNFAWQRESGQLWLLKEGFVWRYTFTNEGGLSEEGRYDLWPSTVLSMPLKRALLSVSGLATAVDFPPLGDESLEHVEEVQQLKQMHLKLKPETADQLAWGATVNGLRAALIPMPGAMELKSGAVLDHNVVLQNVSDASISVRASFPEPSAVLFYKEANGQNIEVQRSIVDILSGMADVKLEPQEIVVATLLSTGIGRQDANLKSPRERTIGQWFTPPAGEITLSCQLNIIDPSKSSLTENLRTGEIKLRMPETGEPVPDKPKTGDTGQRRKVDWSKFPVMDKLANPYDPEATLKLAAEVKQSKGDIRKLMVSILQASAEKAGELRPLLQDEELKQRDDEHHSLALALAAYDYSLNANPTALQFLLDALASEPFSGDPQAAVPLGYIDEWDAIPSAQLKHFCMGGDGASSISSSMFWDQRKYLYPEKLALWEKQSAAAPKLDTKSLQGVWKGNKNGVSVELRIGEKIRWEIRHGEKQAVADLTAEHRGNGLDLTRKSPKGEFQILGGVLFPGAAGTLSLQLGADFGEKPERHPQVKDLTLKRIDAPEADQPGTPAAGKPKGAAIKLTPDALIGTWRGTVNEEQLMLSFHRLPAETDVQLDIYFGKATIGVEAGFTIAEDGGSAAVVQHSAGGGMKFGTLIPDETGKLRLELYGRQQGQQEVMMTHEAEADATTPQQKEARALFELWKSQEYEGLIPYWNIDRLADEVRAFVQANPNLDSAAKLQKLLPRFATRIDQLLPQAEAANLLNDVAYYSTKPIEAYLAREEWLKKLTGCWRGELNGVPASLRIRPGSPVDTTIVMDLNCDGSVYDFNFTPALDGASINLLAYEVVGKPKPFGRFVLVTQDTLRLTLTGKEEGVIYTRKVEPSPTEPKEQAARELFEIWKLNANAGGSIPGTFIGKLASEVRAYAKSHSDQVNAQNIVKLLPRFVASRDWTPSEAIKLLDDVAYYSTDPIQTCVAKSKNPTDALEPTKVDIQDIPVQITKWSEPLRGLRIGLQVVGGEWKIGGKVKLALWLHNTSDHDITFDAAPTSAENGVTVTAVDAEGKEHHGHGRGSSRISVRPTPCTLPAGTVAEVKTFELPFENGNPEDFRKAPKMIGLKPGIYKLACSWIDAAGLDEGKDWKGTLQTPELEFTLADKMAQVGGTGLTLQPTAEQKLKWGEPANGLRMALAWAPTSGEPAFGVETEFYLAVQNVSDAPVHFLANTDAPNPRKLTIRKDGKPLSALNDPTVMPGDWLLKPREVAFIKLFQPLENGDGKTSVSATVEADVRAFPQYSLTGEMNIEKAPEGAWTGKLVTGETRGSMDLIPPQSKDAQALLKAWSNAMRMDGKIPGGLIGKLSESVQTFIKSNPSWATTPQLQALLPRLDATHDWSGQDAVALLNEVSALQETPIQMALEQETPIQMALEQETQHLIRTGAPLPAELAKAPWGETLANGLRHAWLMEPNTAEHPLGTALKARALIHNAGKEPVTFRTRSWHQLGHKATDAKGAELKTESVEFMTRGILLTYRLAPGDFIEVTTPGIGLEKMGQVEKDGIPVGTWIEAQAGDDLTISTTPIPLMDWNEDEQLKLDGEPRWWLDYIRARLARHLPFPDEQPARERLLYRVVMELFGTPVSAEINAAFVADKSPKALETLAELLFHRQGQHACAGSLQSGVTKFRVTAQKNRWIEIKPNQKCDIGNGLFAWITSEPVGNSFRSYLTIDGTLAKSSSGHAGLKVHDSCALPYGLGTGAVTIAPHVVRDDSYRIAIASANGVDGLGFSIRGFEDHQDNWHLSPDLTSPRNYSSLRDVDETLREWARQIIPNLKPEYGIPPGPEFEFRLIAKDDEPAQIVCADAPPKGDDRPVPVRFYRLGKVLLPRADLEGNGGYGGDMCQAINYKVKDSAAGNFEAICKELNGREAVLIVKEKIRGKVKLAPGLQKISAVYSMNEFFRLFEIKLEPPSNQAPPSSREAKTEVKQKFTVESLKQRLEVNPNDKEAHFNLAVLLVSEGKRDLGKVHYERALELGVKRSAALDRLFSLPSK